MSGSMDCGRFKWQSLKKQEGRRRGTVRGARHGHARARGSCQGQGGMPGPGVHARSDRAHHRGAWQGWQGSGPGGHARARGACQERPGAPQGGMAGVARVRVRGAWQTLLCWRFLHSRAPFSIAASEWSSDQSEGQGPLLIISYTALQFSGRDTAAAAVHAPPPACQ